MGHGIIAEVQLLNTEGDTQMEGFTYENQGTNTLLVYEIQKDDVIDSMSLGMITNNKISGIAPCVYTQIDEKRFLKYNVSAKITVRQFFAGQVNRKRLLGVFSGIVNALLLADDYMIDANTLLLNVDYIFVNVSTCETTLICLPVENMVNESGRMVDFFKTIMFSTQFDQSENCVHVAKIINFLNSAAAFSLEEFKRILDDLDSEKQSRDMPSMFDATTPIGNLDYFVKQPTEQKTVSKTEKKKEEKVSVSGIVSGIGGSGVATGSGEGKAPKETIRKQMTAPSAKSESTKSEPVTMEGMAIPGGAVVMSGTSKKDARQAGQPEEKKDISLFYLLQHYNKENAAAYKAQKEMKKQQSPAKQEKKQEKKQPRKMQKQAEYEMSMQVPGRAEETRSLDINEIAGKVASDPMVTSMEMPYVQQDFGDTVVLDGGMDGGTTVLSPSPQANHVAIANLQRVRTGEKVCINKSIFRIGRERSFVDLYIGDNTAVGRSHASILEKNGEYFIVDMNSTNHTFVNDRMIQSNIETKLQSGDRVVLANEAFVFSIQ
jgi:hypothetical protein